MTKTSAQYTAHAQLQHEEDKKNGERTAVVDDGSQWGFVTLHEKKD